MIKEKQALLMTMKRVILDIRRFGYEAEKNGISFEQSKILADLADAIHNIPAAIVDDSFDLDFHTRIMLGSFDERYQDQDCIKPFAVYKHILENELK